MSMEKVVAVATVLGALANIVMAVAAGFALTLWRKQISGASHHELAKKLSGVLRQVAITHEATLHDLQNFNDRKDVTRSALAGLFLPDNVRSLDAALHELGALEGQVAVQWGDEMLRLVAIIRTESVAMVRHIDAELADTKDAKTIAMQILYNAPRIAPTFVRGTYQRALGLFMRLVQDWLGAHVGREGASFMSTAELAVKRKRIDDEVAQLAEREQEAVTQERAGAERKVAASPLAEEEAATNSRPPR
jgi:hypothetical protein